MSRGAGCPPSTDFTLISVEDSFLTVDHKTSSASGKRCTSQLSRRIVKLDWPSLGAFYRPSSPPPLVYQTTVDSVISGDFNEQSCAFQNYPLAQNRWLGKKVLTVNRRTNNICWPTFQTNQQGQLCERGICRQKWGFRHDRPMQRQTNGEINCGNETFAIAMV